MHRVFRDALSPDIEMISQADPSDAARVAMVGTYYDNVLRLLKVHHEGEDELLTPRLLERCDDAEQAEVERIAGQHQIVLTQIDEAESRVAAWVSSPSAETAAAAAAALSTLEAGLIPHLDEEEREVLPIAARYIFAPEWGELPSHGMQHFTGDKLWLILGLIRAQMTPDQLANMDAHMPPPVAEFWTGVGEPMYEDFVVQLRA